MKKPTDLIPCVWKKYLAKNVYSKNLFDQIGMSEETWLDYGLNHRKVYGPSGGVVSYERYIELEGWFCDFSTLDEFFGFVYTFGRIEISYYHDQDDKKIIQLIL